MIATRFNDTLGTLLDGHALRLFRTGVAQRRVVGFSRRAA
jgi:hypothetical protein